MPKYDVGKVLYTTRNVDGEKKPYDDITGVAKCPKCGFEHSKPITEEMTVGRILVNILDTPPDEKEKKSGKESLEDYQLALDIELALTNKTFVEMETKKAGNLQERLEKSNYRTFIVAQVYQALEEPIAEKDEKET